MDNTISSLKNRFLYGIFIFFLFSLSRSVLFSWNIAIKNRPIVSTFSIVGRDAQMNYCWNEAWTLFSHKQFVEALPRMEKAAQLGSNNGEVLYDLAVIRLAAGSKANAVEALKGAISLNPKLKAQALKDNDLARMRDDKQFLELLKEK